MEDENLENETPTNEDAQDITPENEPNEESDKLQKAYESQKVRAEKAEAELKKLKAKAETETPKKEKSQSNEPDYAKIAYLNSKKVRNADDQRFVMEEAERLKLPLTDVLAMKYIKSQLQDAKDQRIAEKGLPSGKGKSGGNNSQDVDYHLAKGTTPEDPTLANKVIEARMAKEINANKFSEELYTG